MKRLLTLLVSLFILGNLFVFSATRTVSAGDLNAKAQVFGGDAFWNNTPETHAVALQQATTGKQVTADSYLEYVFRTYVSSGVVQILGQTDKDGKPIAAGAVQFFASNIGTMLSTPPVSTGEYIAYYNSRLSIPGVPTAYAAGPVVGSGFSLLQPLLNLWTLTRNLAYLFFAIAFIVIGVMIILRQKIDQKTVITIQVALPKIIVALILVTFSYAIAGFLIDLMYVLIALIFTLATQAAGAGGNMPATLSKFSSDVWGGQSFFVAWMNLNPIGSIAGPAQALGGIVEKIVSNNMFGTFAGGLSALSGKILGIGTNAIAALIIAIAILWALFKTWFMLLMAYVQIILAVIAAPLMLMMDALPGQNQFGNWLKMMLQNVLIFPMVIIMLLLATLLTTNFGQGVTNGGGTFTAPLIGASGGTSGADASTVASLIGLGILLTMPKALEMLQKAIKAPKLEFGNAWQESINTAPPIADFRAVQTRRHQDTIAKIAQENPEALGANNPAAAAGRRFVGTASRLPGSGGVPTGGTT